MIDGEHIGAGHEEAAAADEITLVEPLGRHSVAKLDILETQIGSVPSPECADLLVVGLLVD